MPKCNKCDVALTNDNWYPSNQKAYNYICSNCSRVKNLPAMKKMNLKDRAQSLNVYGNKCQLCGETKNEFLVIDHVNGGGTLHRKELKGNRIYKWLRHNNYPNTFRVLCHNCNFMIGVTKLKENVTVETLRRRKLKQEIILAYGGKCSTCGDTRNEVLTIDHIYNDGASHRKIIGRGIYSFLKRNNFPKDNYQLLCMNCNCAKSFYKEVAHA